ncbi:putative transcription initiation factor TFIID subunit A [Lyophyllum shimeji]|uniref:TBP-associated factor 12 n=1 Tax=Lyophyllum shimeji TaxID=47721 RepID=A0A9P3PDZ0_LYOSH|nr:putative transcription initiation factor TFIID subunit A [Lyophyllum shimeji]
MDNASASTSASAANANAAAAAGTSAGTSASAGAADAPAVDMIGVLGNLLKTHTGEQVSNERMAQILLSNMATLVKQGKLNQNQILQLKQFADKHKAIPQAAQGAAAAKPATPSNPAFKTGHEASQPPSLGTTNPADYYPAISQTLNVHNPGAVQWAQTRPTLTGGIASGRLSGTPAQIARPQDDASMLSLDDNRTRRKNTPGDQSMRRTIQDLVASVDPNVKIEPEVEDLLLSIADEFIDSVTNFACRLAKHRGGDSLEVRDLQLHLERNHNIRIPGFASDETRISLSQSNIPAAPAATSKKSAQGTHMTLRSQRLAQVAQAKREGKLM